MDNIAGRLAETAIERDRLGGHAAAERELLRESGLLALSVPRAHGGRELAWSAILAIVRRLAEVDSSLAHLLGFHHLQIASVLSFGDEAQQARYLRGTIDNSWFWGNALIPAGPEADVNQADGSFSLTAGRRFCSGARGSDMLTVMVVVDGQRRMAAIPTGRAGITVHDDWDNIGQRQTDSGTVDFKDVSLHPGEIYAREPRIDTAAGGLRNCISQLILTNLYLGIGLGAFAAGRDYLKEHSRLWLAPGVPAASRDPYVIQRYGNLWLQLRAAQAVADAVLDRLDRAWEKRAALTDEAHYSLVLAISEAKVLAARAGLDVSEQIFDAAGARSTASRFGLDRFWRNVRTHTLHDPLDYKIRDIGNWALNGEWPSLAIPSQPLRERT